MASSPKSNRVTQYRDLGNSPRHPRCLPYTRSVPSPASRSASEPPRSTYQDLVKSFSTNGKVEPLDDFQAHAQAAGQVQDIYVDVGEKVKRRPAAAQDGRQVRPGQPRPRPIHPSGRRARRSATSSTAARRTSATPTAADLSRAKLQRQQDATDLAALQKLLQQGAASPRRDRRRPASPAVGRHQHSQHPAAQHPALRPGRPRPRPGGTGRRARRRHRRAEHLRHRRHPQPDRRHRLLSARLAVRLRQHRRRPGLRRRPQPHAHHRLLRRARHRQPRRRTAGHNHLGSKARQ